MDLELATLVATGGSTLVGLMVTETWTQARDRIAGFFARHDRDGEVTPVDAELEESRQVIVAARDSGEPERVAGVEEHWRARLRAALQADPAAAPELRRLLEELRALAEAAGGGPGVHNEISGGTQHGPVVQGRDFGEITFHGRGS